MFLSAFTANNWWPTDCSFCLFVCLFVCIHACHSRVFTGVTRWLKQSSLSERSQVSLRVTGACIPAKSPGVKSLSPSPPFPSSFFSPRLEIFRRLLSTSFFFFFFFFNSAMPPSLCSQILTVELRIYTGEVWWSPQGQLTVTESLADVCRGSRISSKRSR